MALPRIRPPASSPARRGDLALLERVVSITYSDHVADVREFTFGRVTSVTRDGYVARMAVPSYAGSWWDRSDLDLFGRDKILVQSADSIDVDGVLDAARRHTWPGHPDSPMPLPSLAEALALARPFLKRPA